MKYVFKLVKQHEPVATKGERFSTLSEVWGTATVLSTPRAFVHPQTSCNAATFALYNADTVKEQGELHGVPLMMLANKQDLPEAISPADISVQFDMHKITKVAFRLQPCSGLTW